MTKIVFIFVVFYTKIWADLGLEEGLFISPDTNVTFNINYKDTFVYSIGGVEDRREYQLEPTAHGMIFTKHFYYEQEKKKGKLFAVIQTDSTFTIQNRWDNTSKVAFKDSPKFLHYSYVDSVEMVEKAMKTFSHENSLNSDFIRLLVKTFPLRKNNVTAYNNLAYYFEQKRSYDKALTLLHIITKRFPNRTVTHLNYADNIIKLKERNKEDYSYRLEEAKYHYLSYIAQMLKEKKSSRIPQKLQQNYEKYFNFLKVLNKKIKNDYQIIGFAEGDLNGDSQKDISVVIEYTDSSKIENTSSIWERPSNSNKRVWLVFLAKQENYQLFAKNDILIESDKYTNCDDNFDAIRIKSQNLYLDTHFWCSTGGWEQGSLVWA